MINRIKKREDDIYDATSDDFDRIIDLCKEFPNIGIRISIEGLEDTNNEIRGLPDGYNTQIGERGVKLSGGQKIKVILIWVK